MDGSNGFVRFSRKASLAIHAMVYLHQLPGDRVVDAGTMAKDLGVSHTHMAKVLSLLSAKGLVKTSRGRGGGLTTLTSSDELSVLDVLRAVDEVLDGPYCMLGKPVDKDTQCALVDLMEQVNSMMMDALAGMTIGDFKPCPFVVPGNKENRD